jgi:GMP synthase-like glutamine amidotransferase
MPERFEVLDIGTDYVLGRWRDGLGVEAVRVYELVRGWHDERTTQPPRGTRLLHRTRHCSSQM